MTGGLTPGPGFKASVSSLGLFRIGFAVLLFAALAWLVDIETALSLLQKAQWEWIILALLVVQLQIVLSAVRWQLTAVRLGQSLSVPTAIGEYYLASALNMSLPGGVTGDAARAVRARHGATLGLAAQGVIIERFAGQIALLGIILISWLFWPYLLGNNAPDIASRLVPVISIVLFTIVVVKIGFTLFSDSSLFVYLASFGPALRKVWIDDHQWIIQISMSLAIVISYLMVFMLCSYAMNRPLPISAVLTLVPLVLLSMVIPLTVGGWGVREAAAAALWPLAGLSAESGIATSVLYGAVSTVGCIPGLLVFAFNKRRGSA